MSKKLTVAKLVALVKDLHDAAKYQAKGISTSIELDSLERAFGKMDLQGYRQAINAAIHGLSKKQYQNFIKKVPATYGVDFKEYSGRIREHFGEPKIKAPVRRPKPSLKAGAPQTPEEAAAINAFLEDSSPVARSSAKPIKRKVNKLRNTFIYQPGSPSVPVMPRAPRLGPSSPPFATHPMTPMMRPNTPMISPSPYNMSGGKSPSMTPFSFNSPMERRRMAHVSSPVSVSPFTHAITTNPYNTTRLVGGIGSLPYIPQISSSPWTPPRTSTTPPDPFRTPPAAPEIIWHKIKRPSLLLGSKPSTNRKRSKKQFWNQAD